MSLRDDVISVINKNPGLVRYKRYLSGGCCRRRTSDSKIKEKIVVFLTKYPQFKDLLEPLIS